MTLSMRPYSDADLPVLQDTFARWIAEAGRCGYDHVGELPHRIYENLRGRRPVGSLVHLWEDASRIVGLAVNLRFGSAFDVFAAPCLRGSPAELRMLRAAYESTAAAMDPAEPYVLTDLFDCDTTRIGLLEQLGFERFRTWDHVNDRDLGLPLPSPALPEGFRVRSARLEDADRLAVTRKPLLRGGLDGRAVPVGGDGQARLRPCQGDRRRGSRRADRRLRRLLGRRAERRRALRARRHPSRLPAARSGQGGHARGHAADARPRAEHGDREPQRREHRRPRAVRVAGVRPHPRDVRLPRPGRTGGTRMTERRLIHGEVCRGRCGRRPAGTAPGGAWPG
ncbi:hypothetical protein [Nonomuraea dietziae]|uniref:hypothetical protein n=1 Tax=Nonomuraea dietziae TaxID=65515 RepID=UPI0031D34A96